MHVYDTVTHHIQVLVVELLLLLMLECNRWLQGPKLSADLGLFVGPRDVPHTG